MDYEATEIKEEFIEEPEMYNAADTTKDCFEEASTNDSNKINSSALIPFNQEDIKSKLLSGEYRISLKRSKSKVWECFARIINENDEEIKNFVVCKKCRNVYKYCQRYTSNLIRHKCYIKLGDNGRDEKVDVSFDTKMEGIQIFSQWIIENGRPLTITEDSGFRKVAQFLISAGADYGKNVNIEGLVPQPSTMSQNVDELYSTYFSYVKEEISSIKSIGFALTTDIFTDNYLKKSFLSLTIHYIYKGNLTARLLGMKSMEAEKFTGENILHITREILKQFDCSLDKNVILVTDKNPHMIAAFHTNKHILCMNHLLNNVVQKAIHEDEDVTKLFRSCSKLVTFLRNSKLYEVFSSTLKELSPSRWNHLYYLLATIKKNWMEIVEFLQESNNFSIISDISITQVTAISKLLQTFEEASKKLEGENYATIHFAFVYVHRLQKSCAIESTDLNIIRKFKMKLDKNLRTIVVPNLKILHKIALYVFPPTNKLISFNENEKQSIKKECKNIMSTFIENQNEVSIENPLAVSISEKTLELFSDFVQENEIPEVNDKIEKEMLRYENASIQFCDDFNVIEWWEKHKEEFPLLYKMSCLILATPASSASSEKVFSMARNLIFEKRGRLCFEKSSINKIMFLYSNMDKFD